MPTIQLFHPFIKSKLIYDIVTHMHEERKKLLEDLVAYTNDPVRYKRRMRMLIQLSQYEQQILTKLNNFDMSDTDNNDIHRYLKIVIGEITDLVKQSA